MAFLLFLTFIFLFPFCSRIPQIQAQRCNPVDQAVVISLFFFFRRYLDTVLIGKQYIVTSK